MRIQLLTLSVFLAFISWLTLFELDKAQSLPAQAKTELPASASLLTVTNNNQVSQCTQVLQNNSFEVVPPTPWFLPGSEGVFPIVGSAYDGNWSVQLATFNGGFNSPYLYQNFQMPFYDVSNSQNTIQLNLYKMIKLSPFGSRPNDKLYFVLRAQNGDWLTSPVVVANGAGSGDVWQPVQVYVQPLSDLSGYTGASVQAYFYTGPNPGPADLDNAYMTNFYLDRIELTICTYFTPPTSGLTYSGVWVFPNFTYMRDEVDEKITMGDHVHLQLPFFNKSNQTIDHAWVKFDGYSNRYPDIWITHAGDLNYWDRILVYDLGSIPPNSAKWADIWVYIENVDPKFRTSYSRNAAILNMDYGQGQDHITFSLEPIKFSSPPQYKNMTYDDCLHSPSHPSIQKYAQYASGADKDNWLDDPDTQEQAIRNLVTRVKSEFIGKYELWDHRMPDTTLISKRRDFIGDCNDYADLTIGLLRSLGIASRFVSGVFKGNDGSYPGHAWVEAYTNNQWRQADASAPQSFNETYYENTLHWKLKSVLADKYPLTTIKDTPSTPARCVSACYKEPVDCPTCMFKSLSMWGGGVFNYDLSCVENILSRYQQTSSSNISLAEINVASVNPLLLDIQTSTFVTRTVPFTLRSYITNNTATSLSILTATVPISEYIDSDRALFDTDSPYQVATNISPNQSVTFTWVITPLLVGSGIPLRVTAESGEFFEIVEQSLQVNEPDTPPDLNLSGTCGLKTTSLSVPITLTTHVLDENLHPFTDTTTLITATVYATPTLLYSTTLNLPYCTTCGDYQSVLNLPTNAPIGDYQVDYLATRPGYDPDSKTTFFFVTPPLDLNVTTNQDTFDVQDSLELTASVSERGTAITEAGISAEITTSAGTVTVPLLFDGNADYTASYKLSDLAANFGGQIPMGKWVITTTADYYGGSDSVMKEITVNGSVFLPLILKGK